MKKIFKRKICNNDAITDIIGTMLLLFIAIALFSVLYFFALSFDANDPAPSTNIMAHIQGDNVYFEHWGGVSLSLSETSIVVDIGGSRTELRGSDLTIDNENIEGSSEYWELGEILNYTNPSMLNKYVHVDVVDTLSNSLILSGVVQIGNRAPNTPICIFPTNGATGIDIDANLEWSCNDPDGDDVVYDVYFEQGDSTPDVLVSDDQSGTSFDPGTMNTNSDYYWQIIAEDTEGESTIGPIWSFTTGEESLIPKTRIQDISPYQTSSATKTITAINETANPVDNVTLWYRWSDDNSSWDGGIDERKDEVDQSSSNEDGSADVGIETNFANCQDKTWDNDYMNIQEENTGGSGVNEDLDVDGFTNDYNSWTPVDTSPYLDQDGDGNYISDNNNNQQAGWFTFGNTAETGSGFTVTLYVDFDDGDGNDDCEWHIDWNGDGTSDASATFNNPTNSIMSATVVGLDTATEINNARLRLDYVKSAGGGIMTVDYAYLNIQRTGSTNYEIDFEYQWTTAEYDKTNEEVCIYVDSHTGSEDLEVNYWDGADWTSLGLIDDTATPLPSWFNFTATGLTSSTYTIQIKGTSEIGDSNQDDWDIDAIMLHTWDTSGGPHGIDWTIWNSVSNPDMTYLSGVWSWTFNFPGNQSGSFGVEGYYEFYSIGKRSGEIDESPPINADAICRKT